MQPFIFDSVKYKAETRQQWQNAAEAWHHWMPVIREWMAPPTQLMLDLACIGPGSRVLDVAAGDGDQSVAAARRTGPDGYVLATDLTPAMVNFAARSAREAGLNNLEARVMDGENLEVEDCSFNAVICRLGLMFFPNVHQGLSEMVRVLKPDGRAAMVIFTNPERNPFFSIPISIIRRAAGLPQPVSGQPGPFSLGQRGILEGALSAAGFREVETHILSVPLQLSSVAECVRFEQESFGVLHQMMSGLDEGRRQKVWMEIEDELRKYEGPAGFSSPSEVIVGVGEK